MSRGFLVGVGWGTAAAAIGLVVASQVAVLAPPGAGTDVAAVAVADGLIVDAAPNAPDESGPAMSVPAISAPNAAAQMPTVNSNGPERVPAVDVAPAELPPLAGNDSAATPETSDSATPAPEMETAMLAPNVVGTAGQSPVAPAAQPAASPVTPSAQSLPDSTAADSAPRADTGPANAPVMEPVTVPVMEPTPEEPTPDVVTAIAPEPASIPDAPLVVLPDVNDATAARPAPGFAGKVDGVKTGRLPSIGGSTDQPTADPATAATVVLVDDPSLPAIDRFAAGFENPENKPLFAILLQDTGGPDIDREALATIDFPVTFVIDPTLPDAAIAADIYRAGGKEVLMLATGIPAGATASDLAVSMEVTSAVLPEAVGVVDLEAGGFQGNRSLATQVLTLIEDQGRGVVSWDKGLNAAAQVAQREGIRHAVIFRSLDSEDEASPLIRRYLDRAAFKAAQDGRVVVAGKTRPETVAALLEWALEGRAATVALAPSTAVMIAQ